MNTKDIRELTEAEIKTKIAETQKEVFNLRFQLANQQVKNNQELKAKRRLIARLNTIANEKVNK